MDVKAFPGYENHLYSYRADGSQETSDHKKKQAEAMMTYALPQGMMMEDILIPGGLEGEEIKLRLFKSADLPSKAPIILDIHGGAFVAGSLDIDNGRCIAIASRVPAIVASVEYRLSGATGFKFPDLLLDCHAAPIMFMTNLIVVATALIFGVYHF